MKYIKNIIIWVLESDHRARMQQAKRIDDADDEWCNAAYGWLFNNF